MAEVILSGEIIEEYLEDKLFDPRPNKDREANPRAVFFATVGMDHHSL